MWPRAGPTPRPATGRAPAGASPNPSGWARVAPPRRPRCSSTTRATCSPATPPPQAGAQVPSRLLTGFHRRIGDDVPMLVEGEPFPPETLTTVLVEGIAEHAANLFGGPPHHLVLTHPGDWGGYRRDVLRRALADAGFTAVTLVPGSIAALGAHLPVPGPGAQVAGVCEFGTDGVNVTLATASGASGWQLGRERRRRRPGGRAEHAVRPRRCGLDVPEGPRRRGVLRRRPAARAAGPAAVPGVRGTGSAGDHRARRGRPRGAARGPPGRPRRNPPPSRPPCSPRWTRSVTSASGRPGRRSRSRRSNCPSGPAR